MAVKKVQNTEKENKKKLAGPVSEKLTESHVII
jgi:hypothetical protein